MAETYQRAGETYRRSELEPRADILARRVRAGKPECDRSDSSLSAGRWE
jgi:hypothetical protein